MNEVIPASMTGLPWWERIPLQIALGTGAAILSDRAISKLFRSESEAILQVVEDAAGDDIFQPTKIPRLVGIQKSSCHWSVAMTIDHLNQVNHAITQIIGNLANELEPRGSILIEDYQPDPAADWSAVDLFRNSSDQYLSAVNEHDTLNSFAKFDHPWFGSLNAHQWHCLAAIHMSIHRRQARKIVALLGVA